MSAQLPSYSQGDIKASLLAAGASGTIYSMVMPETESAMAYIVDGGSRDEHLHDRSALDHARAQSWFDMYREPWTQKQDAVHTDYFDRWITWAAPVVQFDAAAFPFRYPTAGASEGLYKLMAEYAASSRAAGREPHIHFFDGEYEGFPAYAAALSIPVTRHLRDAWEDVAAAIPAGEQFYLSQPSAIDGGVWDHFDDFAGLMAERSPEAILVPDLTYVGNVARAYRFSIDHPNITAFVFSHSKPFGGYYQRLGGVFSKAESPSLFGNKWFKNLQSLAWGTEMMRRHDVFDLPRRYRHLQEAACKRIGSNLGVEGLKPADVNLLGIAPPPQSPGALIESVIRGRGRDRVVRLCLTPLMSHMIDPVLAPSLPETASCPPARTSPL